MGGQVYETLTDQLLAQGREEGRLLLIQKKLAKGKSLEQIADELEDTVEAILPLYEQIREEMNKC